VGEGAETEGENEDEEGRRSKPEGEVVEGATAVDTGGAA
jgi:hypothetical protein